MSKSKKKAYCYLVSNEGRDFYILIPFIYYLEKYENFDVSFEFVWNANKIRKRRPDLVILPNVRGNHFYWQIADYCKQNDVLVFHHDSEGNFNSENEKYDYWGYNFSKEIYCPVQYTWNQKVKNYLEDNYPIYKGHIVVSGAPGFDKYHFMQKKNREELLSKYGKQEFTKVVGYAGWAFGKIYNKELSDLLTNLKLDEKLGVKWLEENRDFVENILETAIQNFPEVLFILKKHPRENFESDYRDSRNEMNQLTKYNNVLYLKDQEEIQDLIAISDIWTAFESTSTLEAWLMKVPTIVINKETDFVRSDIYKGSLISFNADNFISIISDVILNNNTTLFENEFILKERNEIIHNSIGYADGFNHLRTAYHFKPFLEELNDNQEKSKPRFNFRYFKQSILLKMGRLIYNKEFFKRVPKLKKSIWVMENYKLDKIKQLKHIVYKQMDAFYSENEIDVEIQNNTFWDRIK